VSPRSAPGAWKPLLEGPLARACGEALEDLATLLGHPERARRFQGGLASGPAGAALFFAYLDRFHPGEGHGAKAHAFLERAVEDLAAQAPGPGLLTGFTGVAWALEHLEGAPGEEDANGEVDAFLISLLDAPWDGPFDLVSGLAGMGIYALERLPRPSGRRILEGVVDHLERTSRPAGPGRAWLTPPGQLPPWQRALCPQGHWNLGLAHGVPGVVALLARARVAGLDRAVPLLEDAVAWLQAQRQPGTLPSAFAPWLPAGPAGSPMASRIAWCYGDLGVALALLQAARATARPDWEGAARSIARKAALRAPGQAGDRDACLCHGAAGNAHLFNRLFQATGEEGFRRAALAWYQRTLDYREKGQGAGGFRFHRPPTPGVDRW
jgi:lantibiotic modifying enzyme